jgi:S-adenosylmethionine synthetase
MSHILTQEVKGLSTSEYNVEIVERKGLGHPDTICDSVMEQISQTLSHEYRERFGRILHHNCDKGLLAAGQVKHSFGGGSVLEPMRLVIGDRATDRIGNERLNIHEIAINAAKNWFRKHLPRVDPGRHIHYQVELKPGSEALGHIFNIRTEALPSNDTSAAVGYAPLSETERLVLEAEHFLNSAEFKTRFPETGEDVKVMGVRTGASLSLTVAMPFLDRYIEREADYFKRKESAYDVLQKHMKSGLQDLQEITVNLNTLDRKGAGMAGMYLTVLGTSAEDADSGQVGRGNQVNGVIALNRPRNSEAAAGKNPVSHIGKIYNVLSHLLANRIYEQIPGIKEVTAWFFARIGDPIDRPRIVSVRIHPKSGFSSQDIDSSIRDLITYQLAHISDFCDDLAQGRYPIC